MLLRFFPVFGSVSVVCFALFLPIILAIINALASPVLSSVPVAFLVPDFIIIVPSQLIVKKLIAIMTIPVN